MELYKSFQDAMGRKIDIYVSDNKIVAEHNNNQIAEFLYEEVDCSSKYSVDYCYELYSMNVCESYQKAGIGTEIIRIGEDIFGEVIYPEDGTENYPTIEGAALLNSCIRKRIIKRFQQDDIYDDSEDWEYLEE